MARRILNRKDLRADFEAAERRKKDNDEEELEDDEEDSDESDDDAEVEADDDSEEADEEAEEEAPKEEAPKKKKKAAPKEPKPKRSRTVKHVRMKVVWGVFNNSNQRVATFDYPKRKEADDHAAKLSAAKNPPQPFFVQPIKEPMEEKKE